MSVIIRTCTERIPRWYVDSSEMTIDEVVEKILSLARERM